MRINQSLLIKSIVPAFLLGLSFYHYGMSFLPWVLIAPFFIYLFESPTLKQAAWRSFGFGFIFNATVFFWITIVTHWVGVLGLLGWMGVSLYLALLYTLWGLVVFYIARDYKVQLIIVPFAWVLLEWAQSLGVFGITAASLAYSQSAAGWIAGLASFGGMYLVSFTIVLVNTLWVGLIGLRKPENLIYKRWFFRYATVVGIVLVGVGVGLAVSPHRPLERTNYHTTLIQPNIPQAQKLSYRYVNKISQELFRQMNRIPPNSDLYICPESLLPGIYERNYFYYFMLANRLGKTQRLVYGTDRKTGRSYYNSVFVMSPSGHIDYRYDKQRLVPFGEYIPLRGWLDAVLPPSLQYMEADITPGRGDTLFKLADRYAYGVSVCFESIFPSVFYRQYRQGARFFVVVTNDGWFFDTIALKLHLNATAYRALESGSQVFFCANTGESAVLMPNGRAASSLAYNRAGVLASTILLNLEPTFYYRFYHVLAWLSILVVLGCGGYSFCFSRSVQR